MKNIILVIFTGVFYLTVWGQERISPINHRHFLSEHKTTYKTQISIDTINLPFLDDFSNLTSGYPSSSLWMDSFAYINNSYGVNMITQGVATLEGLDIFGKAYTSSDVTNIADYLTSKPINLSNTVDSVFISFFYQPQGLGNAPEGKDTLFLEFKIDSITWKTAWKTSGTSLLDFKQVLVYIPDSLLYNGFQFRFKNIANLSGNNDHWHIDYVYLNDDRSSLDTLINDIAFLSDPYTLLQKYAAMPWDQFLANPILNTNHTIQVKNNYQNTQTVSCDFQATEIVSGSVIASGNISTNIRGNADSTLEFNTFSIPDNNEDSAIISLQYTLAINDSNPRNDTFTRQFNFNNYFAYDDGTPELAYGIDGAGSNPKKFAYQFTLNKPDTLQAIDFLYIDVAGKTNDQSLDVFVWKSIDFANDDNDSVIYFWRDRREVGDTRDFFKRHIVFTEPIPLEGTFYIGWSQTNSYSLKVGFDVHNDAHEYMYYNLQGKWEQSEKNGAPMIRPVFGTNLKTSIAETTNVRPSSWVYPNPVEDYLYVKTQQPSTYFSIFNLRGQLISQGNLKFSGQIEVNHLDKGFYFLKLEAQNRKPIILKFIKNK